MAGCLTRRYTKSKSTAGVLEDTAHLQRKTPKVPETPFRENQTTPEQILEGAGVLHEAKAQVVIDEHFDSTKGKVATLAYARTAPR